LARVRSPNRDKAYEIYKKHDGNITNREIASILNEDEKVIAVWKSRDKWNVVQQSKKRCTTKRKGGQPGNKNAVGHGGTGPPGNANAVKHGLFQKYLPQETLDIINQMPTDPLDILWDQIQIANAAIIRAQQIMYVRDREDKTVEKVEEKDGNVIGERWEVQQAWDKQANFMKAQATAQSSLRSMIKQYDELLNKRWDLATEEQKARIEHLKASTKTGDQASTEDKVKKLFDQIGGELDEPE
jgi:uncharacterized protein YjcR